MRHVVRRDDVGDLFGGFTRAFRQRAHFVGHNRKAASGVAGTCCFNRCV
jgi:hypothetical protein